MARGAERKTSRMRRAVALALIGLAVVVWASTAAVARAAADDAVLASQSCGDGRQRPTRIVFACADVGLYVDHLRWSTWAGRVAVGRGIYHYNDCDPFCVSGHFHALSATIRLYTRRACPGRSHLYYQRATILRSDGRREKALIGCPI
ncbi:MAG: hypothetical protein QOD81_1884 [Solirubrobacteraceae bacterium]|nr:hypothetical protein [Solirubrobacteraceae bacterium]